VAAAVARADEHGADALTMRALADDLGVRPMALYHHLPHKEALLDALVEQVFAEIEVPDPTRRQWRREIARRQHSVREVLGRHPWALALLETRTTPDRPAALHHHESMLATLRAAGCSPALAIRSYVLLDSFVYGFALQEATMPTTDTGSDLATELSHQVTPASHPHLAEAFAATLSVPGYTFADEFEAGLDLLLDGIARWIRKERT